MRLLEQLFRRFALPRSVPWAPDPSDAPIPQRPIERSRPAEEYYDVKEGDTPESIARECYGDPASWTRIAQANQLQLGDPPVLYPGLRLKLP